jgi:hypothetical protein
MNFSPFSTLLRSGQAKGALEMSEAQAPLSAALRRLPYRGSASGMPQSAYRCRCGCAAKWGPSLRAAMSSIRGSTIQDDLREVGHFEMDELARHSIGARAARWC